MSTYADLRSAIKPFEKSITSVSLFQLLNSIGLFAISCVLMDWSLRVSYLLTLLLAIPTGALLVRVFIIQHDCGHGSFFKSRWANDLIGAVCSVLTMTPYKHWRRQHAEHHATWNNLDIYAGIDIYTAFLTVEEYKALPFWRRAFYRVSRHPFVAHIVLPPVIFLLLQRDGQQWSRW